MSKEDDLNFLSNIKIHRLDFGKIAPDVGIIGSEDLIRLHMLAGNYDKLSLMKEDINPLCFHLLVSVSNLARLTKAAKNKIEQKDYLK